MALDANGRRKFPSIISLFQEAPKQPETRMLRLHSSTYALQTRVHGPTCGVRTHSRVVRTRVAAIAPASPGTAACFDTTFPRG